MKLSTGAVPPGGTVATDWRGVPLVAAVKSS